MICKLTDENKVTHGDTMWEIGVWREIETIGGKLCTDNWYHYYPSAEMAEMMNVEHANFVNPRFWECEVAGETISDGLKCGAKRLRIIREIPRPEISLSARVSFAIQCAIKVNKDISFLAWAEEWLSGRDRTKEAAWGAGDRVARDAAWVARAAARAAHKAAAAAYAHRDAWAEGWMVSEESEKMAAAAAATAASEAKVEIDFAAILAESISTEQQRGY